MSMLSPRLQLKVAQKQILTPGLVQMVTVLQLNRLELKDMITQEIAENPVLEETADGVEELTPEEVQAILEAERTSDPSDQTILETVNGAAASEPGVAADGTQASPGFDYEGPEAVSVDGAGSATAEPAAPAPATEGDPPVEQKTDKDPFDEIDFGSFLDDYLDPGFKSPSSESVEKPSFETFLSSPVTLSDHLQSQLAVLVLSEGVRDAANAIIGNLEESGYLTTSLEEIAAAEGLSMENARAGLKAVQSLDPTGVGALSLQECLLLQLDARGASEGVAGAIVRDHLKLLET